MGKPREREANGKFKSKSAPVPRKLSRNENKKPPCGAKHPSLPWFCGLDGEHEKFHTDRHAAVTPSTNGRFTYDVVRWTDGGP